MSRWWEGALRRWGDALRLDPEVVPVGDDEALPRVGEWWRERGNWCLRLDDQHYALFHAEVEPESVRQALSWTLQLSRQASHRSWKDLVLNWFQEYLTAVGMVHDGGGRDVRTGIGDLSALAAMPQGYFVWIHPIRQELPTVESERAVEEVVRAISGKGWLGWIPPCPSIPSYTLLIYYSVHSAKDSAHSVETEPDMDVSPHYAEALRVKEHVSSLLTQLEADAFYTARAAVGCKVTSPAEAVLGMQTALSAWRVQSMASHPGRVCLWAETPVEQLLLQLSSDSRRTFRQMVSLRSRERDIHLTPELRETLEGIVAANLNVSEAARLLYLHRNTLLHRIERIREQTGYDVRNFKDAMVLWLLQGVQGAERPE